jgi:H+/Cl- antiporter ClcA
MNSPGAGPPSRAGAADPVALLRSNSYLVLLAFGGIVGVGVAVVAYFFLKAVSKAQTYVFTTLPQELGLSHEPLWWPLPWVVLAGLLVALTIRSLPGSAGHKPAEGFKTGGPVPPIELPGIVLASLATLCFGIVLGPEAPLIAIGSGLGVLAVHLLRKNAPATAVAVIAAAGSFAAISTLLGSPLVGAFLLMEAAGLGGPMLGVVLVPGLLGAGVGALIFVGLDSWTGFGTFSLAVPDIPSFGRPDGSEFLWAIAIGLSAAVVSSVIRRVGLMLQPVVEQRRVALTPLVGLAVGACAMVFTEATGRSSSEVLFSGQDQLPQLIQTAAGWSFWALVLLVVCKGAAYGLSLSSFRGGPVFPALFLGAAGGIAASHGPGLPMVAGIGMGIGAMSVAMLGLPFTSVLLASVILQDDAIAMMPVVIVAVVVAYIASARISPPKPADGTAPAAAPRGLSSDADDGPAAPARFDEHGA